MKTSPSFQFYPADFIGGTMFMEPEEVGAYIRLLCHQWQHGGVPTDPQKIAKISGMKTTQLGGVLIKFAEDSDGFLKNPRMENIRAAIEEFRQRQAENGKRGGRPRVEETQAFPNPNPGLSQPLSGGLAKQNPDESSHTHIQSHSPSHTQLQKKDVGRSASLQPDDGWISELSRDPTYRGINVRNEFGKMQRWCEQNRKQPTKRRFVNWLNRAEPTEGVESDPYNAPYDVDPTTVDGTEEAEKLRIKGERMLAEMLNPPETEPEDLPPVDPQWS